MSCARKWNFFATYLFFIPDTRWFAAGPAITDVSVSSLSSGMIDNEVYLAIQSEFTYNGVLMAIDLQATATGDLDILVGNYFFNEIAEL